MRYLRLVPAMTLGWLISTTATADWSGKGELGGVLARGNTDTDTVSANLDLKNERGRWTNKAGGSLLRTVNEGVTAADRWELRGETEYSLSDRSFVFGSLRYEDDAFTDFDYQAAGSAGYGRHFIRTEATKLNGRVGIGYRRSELRATGDSENDAILRAALDFERRLTATTSLYDRLLIESGSDNTFLQNRLGLEVKINSALALGLSYDLRRNSDVLPGTDRTDQVLTANLVYGF